MCPNQHTTGTGLDVPRADEKGRIDDDGIESTIDGVCDNRLRLAFRSVVRQLTETMVRLDGFICRIFERTGPDCRN